MYHNFVDLECREGMSDSDDASPPVWNADDTSVDRDDPAVRELVQS